jgi:hypothetical protein
MEAVDAQLGDFRMRTNFQIQVLSSLFFRNKGAYVVGKIINGFHEMPFALPILHGASGDLVIDAALFGEDDLQLVFSFARAYFMVAMEVPSAYVQFLRSLMPRKPRSELYSALGLQKQGKSLFYRDLLMHMRHSSDKFRIAPGIKGMVMLVFDLPSYPYVFKVIKDFFPVQKETTRELIKGKYLLVKRHDRVGRMADTLEYSDVAFPLARFDEELVAELRHFCASLVEEDRDALVIRHVYIQRRMIPYNNNLQEAPRRSAVVGVHNAIMTVRANIFPATRPEELRRRHGKVVFYDYTRSIPPDHPRAPRRNEGRGRDRARSGIPGRPEAGFFPRPCAVPARQPAGAPFMAPRRASVRSSGLQGKGILAGYVHDVSHESQRRHRARRRPGRNVFATIPSKGFPMADSIRGYPPREPVGAMLGDFSRARRAPARRAAIMSAVERAGITGDAAGGS